MSGTGIRSWDEITECRLKVLIRGLKCVTVIRITTRAHQVFVLVW